MLDELVHWRLPGFLGVVGERRELGRVEPELACYLHVRAGEPVPLAGVFAGLELGGEVPRGLPVHVHPDLAVALELAGLQ